MAEQNMSYKNLLAELKNSAQHSDKELDELRRKICGSQPIVLPERNDNEENEEEENEKEEQAKINGYKKTARTLKIYEDLNSSTDDQVIEQIVGVIAELCKEESCRYTLVDQNMFVPIMQLLTKSSITDRLRIQVCRAIGNLCFYNNKGRLTLLESCDLGLLVKLAKKAVSYKVEGLTDTEQIEHKHLLIQVIIGCLHNVTNENDKLKAEIFKLNGMSLLNELVPLMAETKGILAITITLIDNWLQSDEGKKRFAEEKIAVQVYSILNEQMLESLGEHTEEFFSTLLLINELPNSKELLCETKFLEILMNLMEKKSADDEQLRHFGLFLTTILVQDDNVDVVYAYQNSFIFNKGLDWLCKLNKEQLYVPSAVILANFMRSDANAEVCLKDERKPHAKLVEILNSYLKNDLSSLTLNQINTVFSLMGALRNFCIASNLRSELLKYKPIETAIDYLASNNLELKAKSLSIIRLLIKSAKDETGLNAIFSDNCLKMIEEVATNSFDHPIIAGESSRLVCYLPLVAKSEQRALQLLNYKFLRIICEQLKSNHFIMINEAVIALNIMITINFNGCLGQLRQTSLKETLKLLFRKDIVPIEIRTNELTLLQMLIERGEFFTTDELNEEFISILKRLENDPNNNDLLRAKIAKIINKIDDLI